MLGVALIAVCAVATVATGGACGFAYAIASNALKGGIWGAVQGAIGGLVNGAVEYYEENGTLDGSGQHLLESTAQEFVEGTFSGTIDGVGSGALQFAKSPNSFCFIGGTIVLTSKGYKAIEDIRIGDKVLATDPETGNTTEKTVLQTFERQTTEFVDVTIGGETYTTTPEHPFYVEGKNFVNASELEVGDKVVCYDTETDTDTTETKEVEEVHSYETDEPVTVYNFEVHEYHTYHVGEDGVLVHNSCKTAKPNQGQGFYEKGYNPQPGERTIKGYVEQNADPEISLFTDSAGFNSNNGNVGGQFKRLGSQSGHGIDGPHVHQPQRNIAPDGSIYGSVGSKTINGGVTSPTAKDVKQLYQYLNNGKYHQ